VSLKDYLSYYSSYFNTVEINNTFYKIPSEKVVRSWYAQVPKEFKFSVKANRYITHIKRLKDTKESLKHLYELSDILAEKMGCFLFQFPKNVRFTSEALESLITQLDNKYQNIVEFRHKEWWNPEVIQALEAANVGFCTVNGFCLPEDLIVINKRAYVRFHGEPLYTSLYSTQTLSQWAQRIKSSGADEIWIYFNNDYKAYAVQNVVQLNNLLNKTLSG
jgi:uncharacterized protein YecE (DUF72 family)